MLLAQGRFWRAAWAKGEEAIVLSLQRDELPEELRELRELRIEIPALKWNRVVKKLRSDRKLLGGILLDFARHKDLVALAMGSDRLFGELQRVALDATASLVETGLLALTIVDVGAD